MPPRGVKKGTKRARQYEEIKKSSKSRGASESRAEEIAARTVNKEKARERRVAHALEDLDAGHVLVAARRAALGHRTGRRAARATSSTTRRRTSASRAAPR